MRRMRLISGPQGPRVLLDGQPVLLLCSNNYLGLADHPRVREAAAEAALRYGAGAGASRLVSGTMRIHRRLEERLADFEGSEAALLFGSGYLANLGVVSALAREDDVVFSDRLNHASIIDGCRLSGAESFVYDHADVEQLAWGLRQAGERGKVIVTDGVFSMDGDIAPLAEIAELAQRFGALLVVDEAHGLGTIGPDGRGAAAAAGVEEEVDVAIGTLGKALGSYGAYVCCEKRMAQYLVNTARSLIFSTALPPPAVGAAMAGLELLREQPRRVEKLQRNARVLREALRAEGLSAPGEDTPIVPLVIGRPRSRRAGRRGRADRGRVRPGHPAADRARRHLAAAAGGDGLPHEVRAAGSGADPGRGGAQSAGRLAAGPADRHLRPPGRRRLTSRACAGCSSPAPTRASARPSCPPRCARRWWREARRWPRSSPPSPAWTRTRASGRTTTSCWPRSPGRRPEEVSPYRFGLPASPHLARRAATDRARARPPPAAERADRRGRRRPDGAADGRLLGARLLPVSWACR